MMKMMKGGCCCGSVQYNLLTALQGTYYCHCRDCQILSGSAYHVLGIVERDALVVLSGELTAYTKSADSGYDMTREFCSTCGTPLFLKGERFPELAMFTVSSLDNPEAAQPSFQIWTTSKVSWSTIRDELKSFPHGALDGSA